MKSFKADYVFPVCADPIKNGVVTVDDRGKIISVTDQNDTSETSSTPIEQVSGIICPGFINTHCHLELSHLQGKIEQGKGLVDFIKEVQKLRGTAERNEILDAAMKADNDMCQNGIVAVGDIANTNVRRAVNYITTVLSRLLVFYQTRLAKYSTMPWLWQMNLGRNQFP